MNKRMVLAVFFGTLLVGGCASLPEGPDVTALPGSGQSFDRFRLDDADCRAYANTQIGGKSPNQVATDSAAQSAVAGTVIGAAAGALIDGEHGAGVGAAAGLIVGALAGNDAGLFAASKMQKRYDGAYIQCMYAKGHRVPVNASMTAGQLSDNRPAAPDNRRTQIPPDYAPYPPANYPPPPGY